MYTIHELAEMAKITTRTLRYYDQIGLLKPARNNQNGYRCYDSGSALQLQQILFYKELGISLQQIKRILDHPNFNLVEALQSHRQALESQIAKSRMLMDTIDATIQQLQKGSEMQDEVLFEGFSEEKQKEYEVEVRRRWGENAFEGVIDWNSYSQEEKKKILAEGQAVQRDMAALIGKAADDAAVQAVVARWHQHMRYFYDPSEERMLGLGQMYVDDPEFNATFTRIHPGLAEFFNAAIQCYVAARRG